MSQIHLPHNHGQAMENLMLDLPGAEAFQTVSGLFRQLSDSSRVRIFWILCHCEECVVNLSAMVGMSSPAVSHHLKQLRLSGLVVSHRKGKEVYYKAAGTKQAQFLHEMVEKLTSISCPVCQEGGEAPEHPEC